MHRFDPATQDLTNRVLDYVRWRLALDPVPLDHTATSAELAAAAPDLINEDGNDPALVLDRFSSLLARRVLSTDSPRFLSFIPAAPTKASLLFDAVVSASSLNGTSWLEAAGAVHAENQALAFLARTAGLPETAGGCFVSGGSAANLSALTVAREFARHRRGLDRRRPLHLLVSDEAHSSITNTARILDLDLATVPTVDGRLTGAAVEAAIDADPDPEALVGVVATAGTTNAGIVDDLAGAGAAARRVGAWFHVDAAYGGAALLAPSARARFAGMELADSFVVDPHKWLFAPFDCAALLYREPWLARGVHTQDASYLDAIHDSADAWNPSDYAYHLTRRARGLAFWFSLAVHGAGAYRRAIESALDLARWTARRIEALDHLELVREPDLSIVMFRRRGWSSADYDRWSRELLEAQVALVLPSAWRGEPILRFAFLHPDTDEAIVDEVLTSLS